MASCENIGFRIGEESRIDEHVELSFSSSFERELEIERRFSEGNALIETAIDITGDHFEILMDEDGDVFVRDI